MKLNSSCSCFSLPAKERIKPIKATTPVTTLMLHFQTCNDMTIHGCHSNATNFPALWFFRSSAVREIVTVRAGDGKVWQGKQSSKKCWHLSPQSYLGKALMDRFWLLVEDMYPSLSDSAFTKVLRVPGITYCMCDAALSSLLYMKTRQESVRPAGCPHINSRLTSPCNLSYSLVYFVLLYLK